MASEFLGIGLNFPVGLDEDHQVAMTPDGEEAIRQAIWMILSTSRGERVMRPDFGCGIHEMVFGVLNAGTGDSIAGAVREALALWEPRIDVLDVFAVSDAASSNRLMIEINYQVRQ